MHSYTVMVILGDSNKQDIKMDTDKFSELWKKTEVAEA